MAAYRSTPVFDEITLPAALRADHRTKAGTWGVITVLEGELLLTCAGVAEPLVLSPGRPGLVRPEQTHFVTPLSAMRMRVDFHDSEPEMTALTKVDGATPPSDDIPSVIA
jgi:tellurite resistance-related uncharacterized protein